MRIQKFKIYDFQNYGLGGRLMGIDIKGRCNGNVI